ncbi:zinc ABC transporter permease AztB [Paradevosia shaoguanensis]|uniref:Metal ABC transporter permease n=1 Tax=Paradevosia shaoguanensis TaxID=1335043 RepID=A0AA41U9J7_9HYPH|nr:zinc ABC transporter permease AztB [Paradevosia shaoguanensis]MCF1740839.1 metal ABC transporter permease [Paradevosia shaoguanensis]MCI0125323.1 metal ABC transporter permease [Paradevosia shaoguanensis]
MNLFDLLVGPFVSYGFLTRALAGAMILAASAGPVGVFLMLRRMSLAGDAMAHAILPGAAVGFLIAGLQILPMTLGGFAAGLIVALLAGLVSRLTVQREDTSLAAFYLISLALGVMLVSLRGSSVDLMHVLFGSVLALNNDALVMIGAVSTISLATLAVIWRPLFAECLDPTFLRSVSKAGPVVHFLFLGLVVLNLVGGFQALGTLLAVGLMMLPAAAARFWVRSLEALCALAIGIGMASSYLGLLLSYYFSVPSGPAIILVAGGFYTLSLIFGTRGIVRTRMTSPRHRIA